MKTALLGVALDENGEHAGYEDVFTKLALCREHHDLVGSGADPIDQFVR